MTIPKYLLPSFLCILSVSCGESKQGTESSDKPRCEPIVEIDTTKQNKIKISEVKRVIDDSGAILELYIDESGQVQDTVIIDSGATFASDDVDSSAVNGPSIAFTVPDIHDQVEGRSRNNISINFQDYTGDSEEGINIEDLSGNMTDNDADDEEEIHEVVEQDAEFPGGQDALLKYLRDNVKYPAIAYEQDLQGMVILHFVVERDGSVGEVQVKKSLSPECDREAIRLVKSLPHFIPARNDGRPVRKWFTVPVRFIIQ